MLPLVDLRSDTVTRPTPAMLAAMMAAPTGDDVYGEDPTVNTLEDKAAAMFGMEAGLYCPSGTMTNQIAIKALTQPGDEVICDRTAHIYNYEGGGIAVNSACSVRLVEGERGLMQAQHIVDNYNDPDNVHFPRTALVALENTANKGGGSIYTLDHIAEIHAACQAHNLPLHLDGARVFNALVETGEDVRAYSRFFASISICLSKGLGAPVGSVLLGSREFIRRSRRIRKVLGGGMRQAGYIAAAGLFALEHNIGRLKEDHVRARILADTLSRLPWVESVVPQQTNIVIFSLRNADMVKKLMAHLEAAGIKASAFGPTHIRMVTHLDIDDDMLERVTTALSRFN